jgi:hypothetical protein
MSFSRTKALKGTKALKTQKETNITTEVLLKTFLETKNNLGVDTTAELEIRFGNRNIEKITKNRFDSTIKYLLSKGFNFENNGVTYLNISIDNIRIKINNVINIQKFCNTNQLPDDDAIENGYSYMKKIQYLINDQPALVNYDDFNFRISYSKETSLKVKDELIDSLKPNWTTSKKNFRLITRYTLIHPDYPVKIDLSIVRDAYNTNIRDSNIFKNTQKYEIEVEVSNTVEQLEQLNSMIFKISKYILCGLQNTNYPVSYNELKDVGKKYLELIGVAGNEISPNNFIGPSSVTLQISNITQENTNSNAINIRKNYCVTDKADGDRKLLYINKIGKIYLINTQGVVEFTGAISKNEEIFNTLLDGEHIKHNKNGSFSNIYAAFDIYFLSTIDVRGLEFKGKKTKSKEVKYRWELLDNTLKTLNPTMINTAQPSPLRIEIKTFYDVTEQMSIFKACEAIQKNIEANNYEYNTDGLIFTPLNYGVGLTENDKVIKSYKHTWDMSFKWKPAEFNTIDFLVTTKKTANKTDFIGNKYDTGTDVQKLDQIIQYKTLILRVGYDVRKHGYANPYQYIIDDNIPLLSNTDKSDSFKPVQFIPSNPYDPEAGLTNIELKLDAMNEKQMFTEENEVIEDNTIIECRYDMTQSKGWKWIPLRIRYDKSAEYRAGYKSYGNAYHTAQNNWFSIHNPITLDMITTGNNIPDIYDEDIYYNESPEEKGEKKAKGLRDFHNLVVKNRLINSISKPGDILIDYAVGRGGDLPKWNAAKLAFVFGIDYSKDNILNPKSGVCSRYLTYKQKFSALPGALFVHGNSNKNIKDTSAFNTEQDKVIAQAIFGIGKKEGLPKGVIKSFGIANEGFNISSIQFALHYMFENIDTLNEFLINLSQCTKLNGYFIGTCFNGKKIFKLLNSLKEKEIYTYFNEEQNYKLLEITKQYTNTSFNDDISSLGYAIDIYQSSINKNIREYLVNFDYFTMLLENYGFVPLTPEELKKIGFSKSVDSFEVLYDEMLANIKSKKLSISNIGEAQQMLKSEKEISFLNNYFIFKKVRNVEIKDINLSLSNSKQQDQEFQQEVQILSQFNEPPPLTPQTSAVMDESSSLIDQVPVITPKTGPKTGPKISLKTGPKTGPKSKVIDSTPVQAPISMSMQTPTPELASVSMLKQTPPQSPLSMMLQTSAQTLGQAPAQTSAQTLEEAPAQTSAQNDDVPVPLVEQTIKIKKPLKLLTKK